MVTKKQTLRKEKGQETTSDLTPKVTFRWMSRTTYFDAMLRQTSVFLTKRSARI